MSAQQNTGAPDDRSLIRRIVADLDAADQARERALAEGRS